MTSSLPCRWCACCLIAIGTTACDDTAEAPAPQAASTGAGGGSADAADNGPDGPGAVFAVRSWFFGDFDSEGNPSTDGWKSLGYDVDGYASTKSSATHCQPQPLANPSKVKTDGNGGIDNSFGANLTKVFDNATGESLETSANHAIENGSTVSIIAVDGLGAKGDYEGLAAALYFGSELGAKPAWDGHDLWPISCEGLQVCQPPDTPSPPANPSLFRFSDSYVNRGIWVSGPRSTIRVRIPGAFPLELTIHRAVITMELNDSNPAPTRATEGIISGILDPVELIEEFKKFLATLSPPICEGPTAQSIEAQLRAASDILLDGTQDPNVMCNGISIGVGFEAESVQLGPAENLRDAGADPCEQSEAGAP